VSAASTADILSALDAFAAGELPTETTVALLSDLDRRDVEHLAARWPDILPELRLGIIALALDLTTNRIDLDFQRLAYIAIEDHVPGIREAGFYALNDLGGRETATRIAIALEKETNAAVVAAAASAAAPYVLQYVLQQLDDQTGRRLVATLRAHATQTGLPAESLASLVTALATVDEPWVEELVRDASASEERDLQVAAVVAMGRTANDEWLEFLEEQLQDDDVDMRRSAATAMGEIGSEAAVEMLAPLLDDESVDVVAATLVALGDIGGEEALGYLRDFEQRVPEELEDTLEQATEMARGDVPVAENPTRPGTL
jgi:hypothetical protein